MKYPKIRSMFRVLGMYNFVGTEKFLPYHTFILLTYTYSTKPVPKMHKGALNRSEIVQVAPCICNATEVFMNSYL